MDLIATLTVIILTLANPFAGDSTAKPELTTEREAAGGSVMCPAPETSHLGSNEELGHAALALFPFEWQQLGYKVVFLGSRPGYRGMTITSARRIEIYVRPGDTPRRLAYTLAHEFGHVIDLTHNTLGSRRQWMELRGIDPSTPWFGCNGCSDYGTPAGDFAEAFASMLIGSEFYRGRMTPPPSAEELVDLAPFFTPLLSTKHLLTESASGR